MLEMIKEYLSFILTALAIIAVVAVGARLGEKLVEKKTGKTLGKWTAKKIACTALFGAIGGVLMILEINVPLIPAFYQLDLSEVAGMMAGFLLGPVSAVVVEFIKVVLHIVLHGTHSFFVGEFASFVLGCVFILPASYLYMLKRSKKRAVIGLLTGSVCLIVLGAVFNAFYLIPRFAVLYGIGMEGILAMAQGVNAGITSLFKLVLFATIPFNIIKAAVLTVIVLLIYKPLSNLYHKI